MKKNLLVLLALLVGSLVSFAAAAEYNYADALDKTFMFYEAQRSGKLLSNGRVKWRGSSGLRDGFAQGVNLVGGYYDSGDHVKFGLPMAFTTTMLSWGAIDFQKEITNLNQMGHALGSIKWATDYFLQAHPQPNVLWAQVGDGDSDHYCWQRAEDMTTSRTAYKLDEYHPGSDLAGETAAALASASIAFKPYNSSYSSLLLVHAKQLFTFADRYRGLYDNSIKNAKEFYPSSSYSDELLWAAAWLYRASGEEYYLKYVVDNAVYLGGTGYAMKEFSWDNKYAGLQILLSKILLEGKGGKYTPILKQYQAKANYFACACLQKNDGYNAYITPGGMLYVRQWNNMQYVSSAAFLMAVYSDYLSSANAKLTCPDGLVQPIQLLNFAKSQGDYILGKNPKSLSYLVGYGPRYPTHVHHRGASIASIFKENGLVGCVQGFDAWYYKPGPNPNVVYGALVGGPGKNDEFSDDRSDYEQTEPSISGSAPLIGLFSKLQSTVNGRYASSYVTPSKQTTSVPKPTKLSTYASPATPTLTPESEVPVKFFHSVTDSWDFNGATYYRHKVIIKNTSTKTITGLELKLENLTTSTVWGLAQSQGKNSYKLPHWIKALKPGEQCSFVYVQGGPQAKVSVLGYHY